jgi:hypothetical protein
MKRSFGLLVFFEVGIESFGIFDSGVEENLVKAV